jgi:predicted N-acyltransferase
LKENATFALVWKNRISQIEQSAWDRLSQPLQTPFLEWDWLNLLEQSGSITEDQGWYPQHLTVWQGNRLVAAAPLYVKDHSEGEFVFDYVWADVSGRLGADYYPKLIGMSPATPTTGYRFLIAQDIDESIITEIMLREIDHHCLKNRLSGINFLFADPAWAVALARKGYHSWQHQSYAWFNRDFQDFSDYLKLFKTNQRRNIKRERFKLKNMGISFKALTGSEITKDYFPLMYEFYCRTNEKFGPWSCKFLNEDFFLLLQQCFRHRLLFMAAFEKFSDKPAGMSMLVSKGSHLYGRYWGCSKRIETLHFSTCYYEPIEWAIKNKIDYYDPGIGGMHKTRRGFIAVANYSLHRFFDPRLMQILSANIRQINHLESEELKKLNRQLPFSKFGKQLMNV